MYISDRINVDGLSNVIAQNNGITSFSDLQTLNSLQLSTFYRFGRLLDASLRFASLYLNIPLSYHPHFHRLSIQLLTLIRSTAFRRALLPMAGAEQKSFLGTLTPWSTPRSATPAPQPSDPPRPEVLQRSQGEDHTVTHMHRLSMRRYPPDCPPLKVRWFYAVDSPKRKPSIIGQKKADQKPLPSPKKFIPFPGKDSQSIETTFQKLSDIEDARQQNQPKDSEPVLTQVPVNEDFLFNVDVEQRELSPTYWIGPVYEVRRGTWFIQDGSSLKPCEENLATQLEEGYIKLCPWRSQPSEQNTQTNEEDRSVEPQQYRLFGAYMNRIVGYQDATTAWLMNDDFMSRFSTSVYQKLGGVPGTKLVRGFEPRKPKETPEAKDYESRPKSTLERQMSSLAGEPQNPADLEEQARRQEEQEMEESRKMDGTDREREVDHLVLVTHGIGQRLGLRLESINFIHDVNVLRKTLKTVYKGSPDLQALNSAFPDSDKNCRVQVLPVCWRHLLDFPYRGVRQNRKELDLTDADALEDDAYPSLSDITLESVPAVRNLISDLAMDVLLYQSGYCEHISNIVIQECNRILRLYRKQNPSFKGSVSLCGHSLGSAIIFDILCHQPETNTGQNTASKGMAQEGDDSNPKGSSRFDFDCEELFCLGSPIALFQMLKGKTIGGYSAVDPRNRKNALDVEIDLNLHGPGHALSDNPGIISMPKCRDLYNIFHPSDPVSYRVEPLISPAMATLKPQPLPSVKKSLWTTSGQSLSILGSRMGQSVGSLWTNFTTGVASSLLNRSLGLNGDEAMSAARTSDPDADTNQDRRLKFEDAKVRALNANGRVDYSIQEGAFDISLIASIASHLTYWGDEDVNHFMLSQMLSRGQRHKHKQKYR
ncbi:Pc13g05490 [Penicillium rubens Wisconsin 54-1255]|uniref:Pc13g05490 protein n=1 Tax=Penicillium rubens (strain ATCC 28089 / DSM 1075 / NRRL 1951 / Wisconsin 54-1255) TaxID=500485 RepID=B6H2M7_PENRW|nr:Pc13g05490 [Penicillium rubens Wisconsin 54-1255]